MSQIRRDPSAPGGVNPFKFEPSRRQALALGGAGLGAWFLASCSSGDADSSPSSQSGGAPKKGGTLRISFSDASSDDSLAPDHLVTTSAFVAANSVFDQLATLNSTDFTTQPALAESWDLSEDAKEWTIHLRSDVKWHDGSDFTSKDVVYAISRWLDPETGNPAGSFVGPYFDMSGVSAPDASTVVLKLKQPNAVLMQTLANLPYSAIVKDGTTDFTLGSVVGTGPFKLTEWSPGNGWTMIRNEDYWGGAPYLDGIEAKINPDQSSKIQAALAESTDITDLIPTSLWTSLQERDNVQLEVIKSRQSWVFAFDQSQAPFDDQRVVAALKLATDRDSLVKNALLGQGTPVADVPIAPDSPWYPSGLTPEYDVERAKELLAEAGFADGLDITLSTSSAIPGMTDVAQAWQQIVKEAGINVTLDQLTADTYYTQGWMASPAFMDYWTNFFPPTGFDAVYGADASFPLTHHADPEVDALARKALASTDPAEQIEYTQDAYLAARESFGYVIPAFADAAYARSPRVNGVVWSTAAFDFRKTWLA